MRFSLTLFVFNILTAPLLRGQPVTERQFDAYTTARGLSHNTVTGITQDSIGYIWVATASGLNRFDGNRFVQFHSNSDSLSLASEELTWLNRTGNQTLVVHTTGLHIINTRTGKTRNLFIPYHDKQYQYKFNIVERTCGDEQGNLFVLTRSRFYHFDKDYRLVFRYDHFSEEEVPVSHLFFGRELIQLDAHRLMIASVAGLHVYDRNTRQFKKMQPEDCPAMTGFMNYPAAYYLFLQQRPGHFFMLTVDSDTLAYIDVQKNRCVITKLPIHPAGKEFRYRTRLVPVSDTLFYLTGHFSGFYRLRFYPETGQAKLYTEKLFPSYRCNALLTDREKNLWVATNQGLFREDPWRSQIHEALVPAALCDSFPDIRVDDIQVSGDRVYAGTRDRGGLLIYDKKNLQFLRRVSFNGYGGYGNYIYAMTAVDENNLLLGTDRPLLLYNTKSGREKRLWPPGWTETNWTNDLHRDRSGNVWISSANTYRYDPLTQAFTIIPIHSSVLSYPFVMQEDREGFVWMAGHGLARYNPVLDSIDLVADEFPAIKIPDKQINSMIVHRGVVWFNSNNNGLTAYDIREKTFRHYTRLQGMPDDNIASMIVVDNKLWMACYASLACMDLATGQIVSFGKEDGFPETPIIKGARFFYDSTESRLYLGFAKSFVRFNPAELLRKRKAPNLFIESVAVNGKNPVFLPGGDIRIAPGENNMLITIGSIGFSGGAGQRFAYRIRKNAETPWLQLGEQPAFSISNLAPGHHIVEVKTYMTGNRWPEKVKELHVYIAYPFWQKAWFMGLMVLLAGVLIYLLIRWRTGVARKKEMEKTKVQALIAEDYRNQFELEQISHYFSSSLAGKETEEEVLWDVTSNLIGRMGYVDCMIYLWNADKTKMIQKAAFGPKGDPEAIQSHVFDVLPGQGVVGYVMQTREPLLIPDTRKDPRYRMDEMIRLSEICVPIIHDDELIGIIDSEHHELNYYKERDLKILTTIATLVGNKLKQIESRRTVQVQHAELASINEQLAEARLSALQAQMNPHFVFNALNSIKRMILDGDNDKASRYLSKFATMIRMTLDHSREAFVTPEENIGYLRAYLEMEQLRFDESFTYDISTDEQIDMNEKSIPSLMMQPLVENAIWHGLMQVEGEKRIWISFRQQGNRITCTIEDNGIGYLQAEQLKQVNRPLHRSMGISNLHNRIKIMNEKFDTGCTLEITDLQENGNGQRGTRVLLQFNALQT